MRYEASEPTKKAIDSAIKNKRELSILYDNCCFLNELNPRNSCEVSNAIILFLNFDIKAAHFDDLYWYATKRGDYIFVASYDDFGNLVSFNRIEKDVWYEDIKPLLKCYLEAAMKVYGTKLSSWYMEINNKWHLPYDDMKIPYVNFDELIMQK